MTSSSPQERPAREPARGWGAVAAVIGAVLRDLREGDKHTRRRVSAVTGGASAIGLAVYVAQWGTGYLDRRAERDERRDQALVQAIEKLSDKIDADRDTLAAVRVSSEAASRDIGDFVRLMATREGLRPIPERRVEAKAAQRSTP